jgi:acetyl esterase
MVSAMTVIVDPELEPLLALAPPFFDGEATLLAKRRAVVDAFQQMGGPARPPTIVRLPRQSGTGDIELRLYAAPGNGGLRPAIYTMHGGGFVMGSAAMMDSENWQLAEDNDATVVAVDYRLAPETSFPGPLEDCYAGLIWLFENAPSLAVDPNRIVIMGESAGGGLAASTTLLARDRKGVRPAAQLLVYPMLDHRTGTGSPLHPSEMGPMAWVAALTRFGWSAMQGAYALDDERAGHFSPALASDVSGLPPTFIAVGALDLFVEEDVAYALRLLGSDVSVECHIYPGAVHGFDKFRQISIARQFEFDRKLALARWFGR